MKTVIRYIVLVHLCLFALQSAGQEYSQEELVDTSKISISFDTTVISFDTLTVGDTATATFYLTNTGLQDVTITQVWPSCGCSVVEFRKTAIKPKERIPITIQFDSHDKEGEVENNFQVFSNAGYHVLFLKGYVLLKQ